MNSDVQETESVAGVDSLSQRLPPFLVIQVPKHGFSKAGLESLQCSPAEFFLDLGRINRVAPVVTRPVRNKADQLASRGTLRIKIVNKVANGIDHLQIRALAAPSDIVPVPQSPFSEDPNKGFHMIFYVKPIANIAAIAVYREWLAFDRVRIVSGMSFSGKWNGP